MSSFDATGEPALPPAEARPPPFRERWRKSAALWAAPTVPPAPPPPPGGGRRRRRRRHGPHVVHGAPGGVAHPHPPHGLAESLSAAVVCLSFSNQLWDFVRQTGCRRAETSQGLPARTWCTITPMEGFNVIWFKLPLLCAIFVASPWILYQVWAFHLARALPARAALGRPVHPDLRRALHSRRSASPTSWSFAMV